MKKIDELLGELLNKLHVCCGQFPTTQREKELISQCLQNKTIRNYLEFRLGLVQLVGIFKLLNQLPVENLVVEQSLLTTIEERSVVLQLNPKLMRLFFETIIQYSKLVQYQLIAELQSESIAQVQRVQFNFIDLLQQDKPQHLEQWELFAEGKVLVADKLKCVRDLIQQATEGVLRGIGNVLESLSLEKQFGFFPPGQYVDTKNLFSESSVIIRLDSQLI